MMSSHLCLGSLFTAVKSKVFRLSTVAFAFSQLYFQVIQSGKPTGVPKISGMMQMASSRKEGTE